MVQREHEIMSGSGRRSIRSILQVTLPNILQRKYIRTEKTKHVSSQDRCSSNPNYYPWYSAEKDPSDASPVNFTLEFGCERLISRAMIKNAVTGDGNRTYYG